MLFECDLHIGWFENREIGRSVINSSTFNAAGFYSRMKIDILQLITRWHGSARVY